MFRDLSHGLDLVKIVVRLLKKSFLQQYRGDRFRLLSCSGYAVQDSSKQAVSCKVKGEEGQVH
jgi:hypothetical protein